MTPLLMLALALQFEHGTDGSGAVPIHYASYGASYGKPDNPRIVMVHGFPDFWCTWRDQLAILKLPHPHGLSRELANNPAQQARNCARRFQQADSHLGLEPEALAGWVKDAEARKQYVEAFGRSSLKGMMAYSQRDDPRPPYPESTDRRRLAMPALLIHGLKDTALLEPALNGTWNWVDDLMLVTIPEAGHFVQQDATEKVSRAVKSFLERDK